MLWDVLFPSYRICTVAWHDRHASIQRVPFAVSFEGWMMFKQRKGQATRYAHLWGAHPYQCYKRRAEHTCEVYILINVFAGDDNSRTREKCLDFGLRTGEERSIRSMRPNQRRGGRRQFEHTCERVPWVNTKLDDDAVEHTGGCFFDQRQRRRGI